jgi:hypothetical protein
MWLTGYRRIVAKTADYTVSPAKSDRSHTRFTNRGASGAVNFTLPTLGSGQFIGLEYQFQGVADQTITVTAASGKAVCFNNAAATSLACSTSGQKIGALIVAVWDGTSWHLSGPSVGVTYTVA